MFTLIGLGNPGERFERTRHNVGFRTVDALAEKLPGAVSFKKPFMKPFLIARAETEEGPLSLVKPLTYMNRSGDAVGGIIRKTGAGPDEIVVVCDNLDLAPGELRIKRRGGSAGQKGMKSLIDALGTDEFVRIFIGIGRPADPGGVVDHVLGIPEEEESVLLEYAVNAAAEGILRMRREPLETIMNELNRKKPDN